MSRPKTFALILATLSTPLLAASPFTKPARITLDPAGVLLIDGVKTFPLNLTIDPGPDAKAPDGKNAYEEFADAGVYFIRTGKPDWNQETIDAEKQVQAAAAAHGLRCAPWLGWDLANFPATNKKKEAELLNVINTFKDSPGMGLWKAADEPEWGNESNPKHSTPEDVAHVAAVIHQNDKNHPVWLIQAPRGTADSLKRYDAGYDIGGIDIYPVSYPPGVHTVLKNKNLSMVGDFSRTMKEVAGKKPFWMTLQIAFSGVVKPERTLRFPTFPEQRFMAYEAIINGSRGLTYFGGGLPQTFNARDKQFGFNWTYFDKVMRPLFDELNVKSPLFPALVAPDSTIALKVTPESPAKRTLATKEEEMKADPAGPKRVVEDETPTDASAMEFLVRETPDAVYVLACKKEGPTLRVRFSGLPATAATGDVLFEDPRTVKADNGSFTDWFGPNEVHAYKFAKK